MHLYAREALDYLKKQSFGKEESHEYPVDSFVKYFIENIGNGTQQQAVAAITELVKCKFLQYAELANNDHVIITPQGYAQINGFAPSTESKTNTVNIHGNVSKTALALDGSQATLNIDAKTVVENLIQEIQKDQSLPQPDKAKWVQRLNELSQDPRLLTAVSAALSLIGQA